MAGVRKLRRVNLALQRIPTHLSGNKTPLYSEEQYKAMLPVWERKGKRRMALSNLASKLTRKTEGKHPSSHSNRLKKRK